MSVVRMMGAVLALCVCATGRTVVLPDGVATQSAPYNASLVPPANNETLLYRVWVEKTGSPTCRSPSGDVVVYINNEYVNSVDFKVPLFYGRRVRDVVPVAVYLGATNPCKAEGVRVVVEFVAVGVTKPHDVTQSMRMPHGAINWKMNVTVPYLYVDQMQLKVTGGTPPCGESVLVHVSTVLHGKQLAWDTTSYHPVAVNELISATARPQLTLPLAFTLPPNVTCASVFNVTVEVQTFRTALDPAPSAAHAQSRLGL